MKGISPRISAPLDVPRPRGGRLIEGFSPKLGRLVRLFDYAVVIQWIALEADPSVIVFCERAARVDDKSDSRVVDFWVQRGERQEMLLLDEGQAGTTLTATSVQSIPLRVVPPMMSAASSATSSPPDLRTLKADGTRRDSGIRTRSPGVNASSSALDAGSVARVGAGLNLSSFSRSERAFFS